MIARPKTIIMNEHGSNRSYRDENDIIECALCNDFLGVNSILEIRPGAINDQREENGITALMAACGRGLEDMVKLLLTKEGIDPVILDDAGRSAIEHSRPFPPISKLLWAHLYPNLNWKEPSISLVP